MTPAQLAEDAIGLFLECLSNIENSGWNALDCDAIEQAKAQAVAEVSEGASVVLPELEEAARQAFGALVGAHAADDSVQGRARIRLGKALGILGPDWEPRKPLGVPPDSAFWSPEDPRWPANHDPAT